MVYDAAVITVSDESFWGRRADEAGPAVVEILEQADQQLIIPMNVHCESLNAAVAATIVMWQMRCTLP